MGLHLPGESSIAAATLATLATGAIAQTAPAPLAKPTAEDFFRDPQMRQVRLSPDGRFLAFVVNKGASAMPVVADIDNGMKSTPVAGFQDADVGSYARVGNERLVYTSRQSQGDRWRNIHSAGLWAVKRDGTEQRQLIHAMYGADGQTSSLVASRQLLGLHFENDAPTSHWFEPRLKQWQAEIDKRLPGRANHIDCRRCLRTGRLLVSSSSDQQPTQYFLFDTAKGALAMLGSSRPWIQGAQMGQRDLHRIPARDGLDLPVMVTMPAGKAAGPRPAVVLVHGGPSMRGTHWTWDEEAQFLASRGYVVIEPEFRGSTGYGEKLFKDGWKQWGLAMQDDVSDALQWAVKQGWVDAKRVCIEGASYGGYAALMGLIRDPDQYRCAVSWVGVTDLNYLASDEWSDLSDVWRTYGMKTMVGDPVKDAEQLRQTSPLRRAKEIRQPVLLAYGGTDRRVTLQHGQDLRSALEAAGHRQVST
ncbi:alpha/beta fold hydrolase [Roseateles sp.]|uniref:alpha/beta hydrolase family protein n=1 Tax=Roseateles sp. TaxID=1971397 RepID=UPI0031CEA3DB